jgi:hypothetical protein
MNEITDSQYDQFRTLVIYFAHAFVKETDMERGVDREEDTKASDEVSKTKVEIKDFYKGIKGNPIKSKNFRKFESFVIKYINEVCPVPDDLSENSHDSFFEEALKILNINYETDQSSTPSAGLKKRSKKRGSKKYKLSKKEAEIKTYKRLLKKKKLTKREDKNLKRLMKRKYCSCLTKVRRSKKVKKGIEYPICLSSIYTKRNKKTPKKPRKICKN